MKSVNISDAEWQVMSLLWERSPLTAGEIIAALGAKNNWKPRTVRTLMDRLAAKGAIAALAEGKKRLVPLASHDACVRGESRTFIERVFGGRPASMLLHVIKDAKLTKEEINQLKKILSEKQK
jgi:BlaI family penicillinase repressor